MSKRMLRFGLLVLILGSVTSAARAAGVQFSVGTGLTQICAANVVQPVGAIGLTANNAGTILAGSAIELVYSANVAGSITVSGIGSGNIAVNTSGSFVFLTFIADQPYAALDSLTINGAQVNPHGIGAAGSINVQPSASSPASNPITFRIVSGSPIIATVQQCTLSVIGGEMQTGTVANAVPLPLAVELDPCVPGSNLHFQVTTPTGGALSVTDVPLTAPGNCDAATVLTLSQVAGNNTVVASTPLASNTVTFNETGLGGPATAMQLVSGNNQSGTVLQQLALPLVVGLQDMFGNVAQPTNVTFAIAQGGGIVSTPSVLSDQNGLAQVFMRLGPQPGVNTVSVSAAVAIGSPVTFTETGVAAPPATISIFSGNGQTATVGQALAPFAVQVLNTVNQPAQGVTVTFAVTGGGGSLSALQATTDASGMASTTLTLGTHSGANTVSATFAGFTGTPVTFTATGVAGAAAVLTMVSGNNQSAITGSTLAPFVVLVADSNSNPVSGTTVVFAVTSGGGNLSATQVSTNSQGQASATLTLGSQPGTNTVTATVSGLIGSPATFTATATSSATTLSLVSGNSQTGIVAQALPPFVVKVSDSNGQGIAGINVTFAVTSGGGSLSATQVSTNAQGQASTVLTLGSQPGTNTVTASASGLAGSPVTFTATAAAANAPVILTGGVVNAASLRLASDPNGAVAPGAFVAIFGSNFSSQAINATVVPLPLTLGTTSVTFNGTQAPLFYVSSNQINAQVPFGIAPGAVSVQVNNGVTTGPASTVTVAVVSPGIFSVNSQGSGPGSILHAATLLPVSDANPAQAGEFIAIYCTGLGPLQSPGVASGNIPPIPPPQTVSTPLVNIGGIPSPQVPFSGAAPGLVSLYQVNAQVPPGTASGTQNVQLTINGVPSNTVTIAVH